MKKLNPTQEMRVKRFWRNVIKYSRYFIALIIVLAIITLFVISIKAVFTPKVAESKPVLTKVVAEVSAYNAVESQTDDTPDIMADGRKPFIGAVACPRDIPFGTEVLIGNEWFTCADRMALKNDGKWDILVEDYDEAMSFGRQELSVYILNK